MEVECLECGRKFKTRSTLPECPTCGGSDVDLACRFSSFSHRVDARTQVMLDGLFPRPTPSLFCNPDGQIHCAAHRFVGSIDAYLPVTDADRAEMPAFVFSCELCPA